MYCPFDGVEMNIYEDDGGKYHWCPVCHERVKFE